MNTDDQNNLLIFFQSEDSTSGTQDQIDTSHSQLLNNFKTYLDNLELRLKDTKNEYICKIKTPEQWIDVLSFTDLKSKCNSILSLIALKNNKLQNSQVITKMANGIMDDVTCCQGLKFKQPQERSYFDLKPTTSLNNSVEPEPLYMIIWHGLINFLLFIPRHLYQFLFSPRDDEVFS